MSLNHAFKNVVSVQNSVAGATSGLTLSNGGPTLATIVKHSAFLLQGTTTTFSVLPTYYKSDSAGIVGPTLGIVNVNVPIQVNARMKSFTGLTGGSISFLT